MAIGTRTGTRKRKRKKGTPTWVAKVPISPALTGFSEKSGFNERSSELLYGHYSDLEKIQDQTRSLWNELLDEALAAIARVKDQGDPLVKQLISGIETKVERSQTWAEWYDHEGFSKAKLELLAKDRSQFLEHVDSVQAQLTAHTLYDTCFRWLTHNGGRPRFKGKNRTTAIRSKQPQSSILITDEGTRVTHHGRQYEILWEKGNEYHDHVLPLLKSGRYLRAALVDYRLNGVKYYRLHVTLDGKPPKKPVTAVPGKLGIDPSLRGSTVIRQDATQGAFICYPRSQAEVQARQARKQYSRRSRMANPRHFDGSPRNQRPKWKTTQGMVDAQAAIQEAHRIATAQQEQAMAELFKFLCSMGDQWYVEKHGTKWWQAGLFGRISQLYAPGKMLGGLVRKAQEAGITIVEVPARKAKLSQTCITHDLAVRKPLSQRTHKLVWNGIVEIQSRDCWSSWLATLWKGDALDRVAGLALYPAVGPRLQAIGASLYQQAKKTGHPALSLFPIAADSLAGAVSTNPKQATFFRTAGGS